MQPDQEEGLRGSPPRFDRRDPAELRGIRHEVGRGLVQGKALVLGHVADPLAEPGRVFGHRRSEDRDLPVGRPDEAEHEPDEGGLAGAVGPDEAGHAGMDVEIDILERPDVPVVLVEAAGLDDGRAGLRAGPVLGHEAALTRAHRVSSGSPFGSISPGSPLTAGRAVRARTLLFQGSRRMSMGDGPRDTRIAGRNIGIVPSDRPYNRSGCRVLDADGALSKPFSPTWDPGLPCGAGRGTTSCCPSSWRTGPPSRRAPAPGAPGPT